MHAGIIEEEHVAQLCKTVEPDSRAAMVTCRPILSESINDCFEIVANYVSKHGGSQVIGWAIWEWPRVMVEAEFHSVWRSPEGELICLTPRPILFDEITFLPTVHAKYEGRQIDNIRLALTRDNDITRFIFLAKQRFGLFNRGDRAYQHGEISFSDREMKEFKGIDKEMQALYKRLIRRYQASDF